MILKIDSTNSEKIKVELRDIGAKIIDLSILNQKIGSQVLLPSIVRILKKHKKTLSDVKSVEVNTGPGSFTGTRVGVSIANALGFALDIPVNGSPRFVESDSTSRSEVGKKAKIALPIYEKSKFDPE